MNSLTGHELFHAIITQAVKDASCDAPEHYKLKKDALQWLLEDTSDFYYICEGAGITNVEEFRSKLKEKFHGNKSDN